MSCIILSETFTYNMKNHRVFSFLGTYVYVTSNVRFISQYALFFEQYTVDQNLTVGTV